MRTLALFLLLTTLANAQLPRSGYTTMETGTNWIGGYKDFVTSPDVPYPTSASNAASKVYVDNKATYFAGNGLVLNTQTFSIDSVTPITLPNFTVGFAGQASFLNGFLILNTNDSLYAGQVHRDLASNNFQIGTNLAPGSVGPSTLQRRAVNEDNTDPLATFAYIRVLQPPDQTISNTSALTTLCISNPPVIFTNGFYGSDIRAVVRFHNGTASNHFFMSSGFYTNGLPWTSTGINNVWIAAGADWNQPWEINSFPSPLLPSGLIELKTQPDLADPALTAQLLFLGIESSGRTNHP